MAIGSLRPPSFGGNGFVQNAWMIRFEGTLTPAVYRRALDVSGRSMSKVAWVMIVVAVIGFLSADLSRPVSWGGLIFVGLVGVMLLIGPRRAVERAFATDRTLADPVTGDADEKGVRMKSTHGAVDLPWTLMHKVVVTPTLVTIYQSASSSRILPRELFADDESWEGFRRLAAAAPSCAQPSPRPIGMFLLWIAIMVVVFLLWTLFNRA
jgi:hypothetical protein